MQRPKQCGVQRCWRSGRRAGSLGTCWACQASWTLQTLLHSSNRTQPSLEARLCPPALCLSFDLLAATNNALICRTGVMWPTACARPMLGLQALAEADMHAVHCLTEGLYAQHDIRRLVPKHAVPSSWQT